MSFDASNHSFLGRRALLKNGALFLAATTAPTFADELSANEEPTGDSKNKKPSLTIGLVTDLHYADKPPAGSRHYRETLGKLAEAADRLRQQRPDCLVELGDFIDAADSVATELGYLKRVNRDFSAICDERHYVLGNHCVHTLNKQEFLDGVEKPKSYYSFDKNGYHFIVLDACFRSDGKPYGRKNFVWTDPNIPSAELEWLQGDLKKNALPTIVFAHQRLDVSNHYGVKNAVQVRKALESSGNVKAVFQGHSHKNDLKDINGIHYCTMVAMIEGSGAENNGYSLLRFSANGIEVQGFRKQRKYDWKNA